MIKFIMSADDGSNPRIGLGLSRANCQKLLANQPIIISVRELLDSIPKQIDARELKILIFAGSTEQTMIADLKRSGVELPTEYQPHQDDHQQQPEPYRGQPK